MQESHITLGDEQERKAREIARHDGTTPERVANMAIDEYYVRHAPNGSANGATSLYDVLVQRGSIGHANDVHDLSTNPDHMTGFGEDARG